MENNEQVNMNFISCFVSLFGNAIFPESQLLKTSKEYTCFKHLLFYLLNSDCKMIYRACRVAQKERNTYDH